MSAPNLLFGTKQLPVTNKYVEAELMLFDAIKAFEQSGGQVIETDVHGWVFTPEAARQNNIHLAYPSRMFYQSRVWLVKGVPHRIDGPAVESLDHSKEMWFDKGRIHREDGPAVTKTMVHDGDTFVTKEWYRFGKLHRKDAPAVVSWINGKLLTERWFENNQLHRKSFAAETTYQTNGSNQDPIREKFVFRGNEHREDGASLIVNGVPKCWALQGVRCSDQAMFDIKLQEYLLGQSRKRARKLRQKS